MTELLINTAIFVYAVGIIVGNAALTICIAVLVIQLIKNNFLK